MRIELDTDHGLWPHQRAHALDDVAFDVVVAMGHHGAVQAEEYAIDWQRRLELAQDLVAHELVVGTVGGAGGAGGEAAALDEGEALCLRALSRDPQRRRAHEGRRVGMLAWPHEHAFLVALDAGRERREG